MSYVKYARRWGWTPLQADREVYAWLDSWLLPIDDLIEGMANESSGGRAPAPGGQG